jgi:MFS family permease
VIRYVLMALVFLHGAFASGMIPVLNQQMGDRAPYAFSLYFAGMVLGQLAIWRWPRLSKPWAALPVYEIAFAGALVYMAAMKSDAGFLTGRLFEGIASGLTLPILFVHIIRLESWGAAEKRVAWLNSVFAGGFVSGPLIVDAVVPRWQAPGALLVFAGLIALFALVLWAQPESLPGKPTEADRAAIADAPKGLLLFFPLFAAKLTYGYMLAFLSALGPRYFPSLSYFTILLILAGIFMVGQVMGALLLRRFSRVGLNVVVPLVLTATMLWFAGFDAGEAIFAVAVGHALLAFYGYHNFAGLPESAQKFALFNLSSDPGMILGALLAAAGTTGGWAIAALGVVPLAYVVVSRRAAAPT